MLRLGVAEAAALERRVEHAHGEGEELMRERVAAAAAGDAWLGDRLQHAADGRHSGLLSPRRGGLGIRGGRPAAASLLRRRRRRSALGGRRLLDRQVREQHATHVHAERLEADGGVGGEAERRVAEQVARDAHILEAVGAAGRGGDRLVDGRHEQVDVGHEGDDGGEQLERAERLGGAGLLHRARNLLDL